MEKTLKNIDIQQIVKDLPAIAERENWVFAYDEDEGALFYSPREIPDGASLFRVTDEYSLYLNEKKNYALEGMFVECFDKNFIEHHEEFKDLSTDLFKMNDKTPDVESLVIINPRKSDSDKAARFKNLFEKTLLSETLAIA